MATIPTVPTITTGSTPSIATLNQLAACVTFVSVLPAFATLSGSQTLPSTPATALTWTTITDRDGGHSNSVNPTRYTAQTPGYYDMSASVTFASNASAPRLAYFQVTTGPNNPGGSGNATLFGGSMTQPAGSLATRVTIGQLSPYLYLGDYVEVYAYQNSGSGLSTATCYWQLALVSLGP